MTTAEAALSFAERRVKVFRAEGRRGLKYAAA
jgi:hypothetical protein